MRADSTQIGTLDDDLTSIAGAIHRTLGSASRMVWIDDDRQAHIGDPAGTEDVPASWIVGTFAYGHSHAQIEDDLRAMAQERSHDSMMD